MKNKNNKTPLASEYTKEYYLRECGGHEDFFNGRIPDRLRVALRYLNPKKGEKILDLGCGRGEVVKYLNMKGVDCIGVDYSKNAVEIANSPNVVLMDSRDLDFEDNGFDAVVFLDIMEHLDVKDTDKTLREIFRVLKKGGRVVIHTPNRRWREIFFPLFVRPYHLLVHGKFLKIEDVDSHLHVNEQTKGSLYKVLKNVGFKKIRIDYYPKLHRRAKSLFGLLYWISSGLYCVARK